MDKFKEYNFEEIETKWQNIWEKHNIYVTPTKLERKKLYILDMFPYPSGSGLHVGHPLGYTATDILTRFFRMNGYSVLHPMGFDSFGLPAEQHAIATGEHPRIETNKNCERFKIQLKRLGFAYDWTREIRTSDPEYYKWTQYIFTLLYNSYFDDSIQKARHISELPIPDSVRERGPLAIQEYQDTRRLAYLAHSYVNFCPELGTILANEEVIDGKSERGGYDVIRIPFQQWMLRITAYAERLLVDLEDLDWPESIKEQQRNWIGKSSGHKVKFLVSELGEYIECFTTRLDTLPGVTFIAVAPEVAGLNITWQTSREVKAFVERSLRKTERERIMEKSRLGINTGFSAINPLTGDSIPIFIAEYVIADYGSGVVMGVPAHDLRDYEFALENEIPIKHVVFPKDGTEVSDCFTELGVLKELKLGDHRIFNVTSEEAKKKICEFLSDSGLAVETVSYKLRDWVFSRQRYWGEPIPVIHWEDGLRTCLDLNDLPLNLPDLNDFKPSSDGLSPLAKAKDWIEVTDPVTGRRGKRDINTMPQWAGSCWYYLRFIDPKNPNELISKDLEKDWMPVDLYVGGAEHAVLHLLYARFWHKVLYDFGLVSTKEPFQRLFNQGMVLSYAYRNQRGGLVPADRVAEKNNRYFDSETNDELQRIVAKMSKSLKNVVDPLEIVRDYGADTLRLYLMFMGPLSERRIWDTKAVAGVHRFLRRFYQFITRSVSCFNELNNDEVVEIKKQLNKLVKKVTEDTQKIRFNTAIAAMMEFLNFVENKKVSKEVANTLVKLLSPYAPHLAEECWEILGNNGFIIHSDWPKIDADLLKEEKLEVVVQVNGKKKKTLLVDADSDNQTLEASALQALGIKTVRKIIVVRNKNQSSALVNIVT
ncbi:MAG: leucine--tRNA ligase [Deltaproteobacteria bacterium]|nr:leucine--tRNA ligase [Deltaproteobacteria bacterium]